MPGEPETHNSIGRRCRNCYRYEDVASAAVLEAVRVTVWHVRDARFAVGRANRRVGESHCNSGRAGDRTAGSDLASARARRVLSRGYGVESVRRDVTELT